jgi:ATP-dependent DNA ligase
LKLRQEQFVIDGELVVLDKDGVSDLSALQSGTAERAGAAIRFRHACW